MRLRMKKYLNSTKKKILILSAGNLCCITWYTWTQSLLSIQTIKVIQALLCHLNMAKARYTLSQESKGSTLRRAAHNPNLSESMTFQSWSYWPNYSWKKKAVQLRGTYCIYQDNKKSAILLEENGKKRSSIKRTWASNIHYSFLTDQVEKGNLIIGYTTIGDFHAKPFKRWKVSKVSQCNSGMLIHHLEK